MNISDDRFVKGLTGKGMQNVRPLFIYLVILVLSLMNVNLFFRPRSYESLTSIKLPIVDQTCGADSTEMHFSLRNAHKANLNTLYRVIATSRF